MPDFRAEITLARPLVEVFDFFVRPANLLAITPPEWKMRLVEAPERLHLGARLVIESRRWGIPQRIISEVTEFEPNTFWTDTQRQGPFRKWAHTHRFESIPGGTRVIDLIEFEPPGGMLGLIITAGIVERELQGLFAYRDARLRKLLETTRDFDSRR